MHLKSQKPFLMKLRTLCGCTKEVEYPHTPLTFSVTIGHNNRRKFKLDSLEEFDDHILGVYFEDGYVKNTKTMEDRLIAALERLKDTPFMFYLNENKYLELENEFSKKFSFHKNGFISLRIDTSKGQTFIGKKKKKSK